MLEATISEIIDSEFIRPKLRAFRGRGRDIIKSSGQSRIADQRTEHQGRNGQPYERRGHHGEYLPKEGVEKDSQRKKPKTSRGKQWRL